MGQSADRYRWSTGKLGLLDSLFSALDEHQMSYHLFDEVFPRADRRAGAERFCGVSGAECDHIIAQPSAAAAGDTAKAVKV